MLSAGAHKSIDFMSASSDNTYEYSEKGKLTSYHFGAAVEFAKRLYLGADFKLLKGNLYIASLEIKYAWPFNKIRQNKIIKSKEVSDFMDHFHSLEKEPFLQE